MSGFVGVDRTQLKSTATSYLASQVCTTSLQAISVADCFSKANKINPPLGTALLIGRNGSDFYKQAPNTPAMCCGFKEMYTRDAAVKCRSRDRSANGDLIGIIDLLVESYNLHFQNSPPSSQNPITIDRANQIFENSCYDWTAKQQDTLHRGTKLLCPRVPDSFPYSSPASRFEQMTNWVSQSGNNITLECCAYGTGPYCPATGCWESPFCSQLLYTYCKGINHAEQVCSDWKAFSTAQSSARPNGDIPTSADYFGKSVVDYCRSFSDRECDAINAIQGLVFDRLVPQLSTNFIRPLSPTSVEITVMNTSGRYVTASVLQRVRNTLFTATPTLLFDPFGTAILTITVGQGDALETDYTLTSNTVWTQSTINSDPKNRCQNINDWYNPPPLTLDVYPQPPFCYDGDAQTNLTYNQEHSLQGIPYDEQECVNSYAGFAGLYGCATCGGLYDTTCIGNLGWSKVACNDEGPDFMCPFCYAAGDAVGQQRMRRKISQQPDGSIDRRYPDHNNGGCACTIGGEVIKCRGDTRGVCSPTSISKYFLSTTRTCVGSSAVSEFVFTNRSDLSANDFPIMGGVVVAFAPSGFSMATMSLQVFPMQDVSI